MFVVDFHSVASILYEYKVCLCSLPHTSQHRRFGSLVFAQVQALDFGLFHSVEFSLFHSVEFSRMVYVVVMVQPGTWGTSFCLEGGAISSFQPESW